MFIRDTFQDYGGNKIQQLNVNLGSEQIFSKYPYVYSMVSIENKMVWKNQNLRSFTMFILHLDKNETLFIPKINQPIRQGDVIQVENCDIEIDLNFKKVTFLIAGISYSIQKLPSISVMSHKNSKRVTKPWGYELWLTGEHPLYSFKEILIRKGEKTSLQYHLVKNETNVILNGNLVLYYKMDSNVANELAKAEDIGSVILNSPTLINITPTVLHRLEAISDVLLYEVSTPHLDDVIRVFDDNARPNGRIQSEHGQ